MLAGIRPLVDRIYDLRPRSTIGHLFAEKLLHCLEASDPGEHVHGQRLHSSQGFLPFVIANDSDR